MSEHNDPKKEFFRRVERCVIEILEANRPVSVGRLMQVSNIKGAQGLKRVLDEDPRVRRKNHKGKVYYEATSA